MKDLIKYKNIAAVIAAVMLILALADWPYGYYIFLRWVVAVSAGLLAYSAYKLDRKAWVIIGVGILLLWNPIAPIHLTREAWAVLDIIGAVLLGSSVFLLRLNRDKK